MTRPSPPSDTPAPAPSERCAWRSPEDRYATDVDFKALVDMTEALIERAQYTPSEIREAGVLACIHYEMRRVRYVYPR